MEIDISTTGMLEGRVKNLWEKWTFLKIPRSVVLLFGFSSIYLGGVLGKMMIIEEYF